MNNKRALIMGPHLDGGEIYTFLDFASTGQKESIDTQAKEQTHKKPADDIAIILRGVGNNERTRQKRATFVM